MHLPFDRIAKQFIAVLLVYFIGVESALAASLETLVMPGAVTHAHAELESDCNNCHTRFDRSTQRAQCLDCHERIADDIELGQGFHTHNDAAKGECNQCHSEHKGRDADIVGLVPELFDHEQTDFPLIDSHLDIACNSCHQEAEKSADSSSEKGLTYFEAAAECVGCHEEDDAHDGNLGDECDSCHTPSNWLDNSFDHNETDFELTGVHADTSCSTCHVNNAYEETPSACLDCHGSEDVHDGTRGAECASCHSTDAWDDAKFDHQRETGFALAGQHSELVCSNCHLSNMKLAEPPTQCIGCHSNDDSHQGNNGEECGSCHNQNAWSLEFDHFDQSGFHLNGAHNQLACTDCHTGQLTDEIGNTCIGCHAEDNPHADTYTECATCHSESSWTTDLAFHHDLTNFPLVGAHGNTSCEQCHDSLDFSAAVGECNECHQQDDSHEGALGKQCEDCHNPVGWEFWEFDHDKQTEFKLTGEHEGLSCNACHTQNTRTTSMSTTCIACHRADDIHRGSFGPNCDQCHSTKTFTDPQFSR